MSGVDTEAAMRHLIVCVWHLRSVHVDLIGDGQLRSQCGQVEISPFLLLEIGRDNIYKHSIEPGTKKLKCPTCSLNVR